MCQKLLNLMYQQTSKVYIFRFEDYMGNLVNFNGLDLSFTIEIKFLKNIALRAFMKNIIMMKN